MVIDPSFYFYSTVSNFCSLLFRNWQVFVMVEVWLLCSRINGRVFCDFYRETGDRWSWKWQFYNLFIVLIKQQHFSFICQFLSFLLVFYSLSSFRILIWYFFQIINRFNRFFDEILISILNSLIFFSLNEIRFSFSSLMFHLPIVSSFIWISYEF